MIDIVDRLRFDAVRCEATFSMGVAGNITEGADEIVRLRTENWQLKQACGYPIPADKETPQNPFKCGICDARGLNQQITRTEG